MSSPRSATMPRAPQSSSRARKERQSASATASWPRAGGATYRPVFSGYASDAIAGRLRDAEVTVLITADGFRRRGQLVPMKETADVAVDAAPSVRTVIVVPRLGREIRLREREVTWDYVMTAGTDESFTDTSPEDP